MLSLLGSNTASQRLLRAVGKGDVRTIEDCLWLESLDAQTSKQRSLVAVAAAAGQYAALTLLLSKGAKPNTVDVGGDTPLHTVGSAQCATRLLEYGAAFEAKNGKGQPFPILPCATLQNAADERAAEEPAWQALGRRPGNAGAPFRTEDCCSYRKYRYSSRPRKVGGSAWAYSAARP